MNSGIYQIQNLITKDLYIGSTVDFNRRKVDHFSHLRKNKHHSQYLQNSFNKWGEDVFEFDILFTCPQSELIRLEQYHINNYQPKYNMLKVAGAIKNTEKVNKSVYKICPNTLCILETFDSVAEAQRSIGIKGSSIFSVLAGKSFTSGGYTWMMVDKYDLDELMTIKNSLLPSKNKPVVLLDLNGEFVCEFNSLGLAADFLDVSMGHLVPCCDFVKKTIKGYIAIYKSNYKQNYIDVRVSFLKSKRKLKERGLWDHKPVVQYDLSGQLIREYKSTSEAGRQLGIPSASIAKVCRGERNKTHNFVWKFKSDIQCQLED